MSGIPTRFLHDKRLSLIAQEKMKEINGAHEFLKASFLKRTSLPQQTRLLKPRPLNLMKKFQNPRAIVV